MLGVTGGLHPIERACRVKSIVRFIFFGESYSWVQLCKQPIERAVNICISAKKKSYLSVHSNCSASLFALWVVDGVVVLCL
jgi:hypothetical protein